jgi:hypothetical protein
MVAGMAKLLASEAAQRSHWTPSECTHRAADDCGGGVNEIQRNVIPAQLVQRGGLR